MLVLTALLIGACGDQFTSGSGSGGGDGGSTGECTTESDCIGADNTCRVRRCSNGQCGFTFTVAGASCAAGVCDGEGECVECINQDQCSEGDLCDNNFCVPAHCVNGALDPGETDVDCGAECSPCVDGLACVEHSDCFSGLCQGNVCTACSDNCPDDTTYCNNGVCEPKIVNGDPCSDGTECLSGNCVAEAEMNSLCCDAPCGPRCAACAEGKTGMPNGQCSPITAGTDPDDECDETDLAACTTGLCNGSGQCEAVTPGTVCGDDTCSMGGLVQPQCDAMAVCSNVPQSDCGLYQCTNDVCPTSCVDSSVCDDVCVGGACEMCGTAAAPTGQVCPPECNGCPGGVCMLNCDNGMCPNVMTCPAAYDCDLSCVGNGVCLNLTLNCAEDQNCDVNCSGDNACENLTIQCDSGPCDLSCVGGIDTCLNTTMDCGSNACTAFCMTNALPTLLNQGLSCNAQGC